MWFGSSVVQCMGNIPESLASNSIEAQYFSQPVTIGAQRGAHLIE